MSSAVTDQPPRRTLFDSVGRAGKTTWALGVAIVALLSSAASLAFTLWPQLKPDPRDSVAANLSVFAVDPEVSLGDFFTRAYGGATEVPKSLQVPPVERGFKGDVVYVRTRVDGFKHRRVRLMASIYLASTQERIAVPVGLEGVRTITLDTPSTSTVQLFWILGLDHEPRVFVRIEMYDGTRMLAVTDSPVISNNRAPLPPA
jgi:hypothetical protein